MTFLLLLFLVSSSGSSEALWQLRAGVIPMPGTSVYGGSGYSEAIREVSASLETEELREGIAAGQERLLFPLAGNLVSRGLTKEAELYWNNPDDPPVNRRELLASLAWFGRFHLFSLMTARSEVPPDMAGRLHEDHCAAVCAAGWMTLRRDGLFHPEDLVLRGDLMLLSRHFPGLPVEDFLPLSRLEDLSSGGGDVR